MNVIEKDGILGDIITECSGWDQVDSYSLDFQLYDVVLAIDTAKFKAGTKFRCVAFMYSKAEVEIYDDQGINIVETLDMKLTLIPRK